MKAFFQFVIVTVFVTFIPSFSANILRIFQEEPPIPKYRYSPQFLQHTEAVRRILAWHPDDGTNVWEQSGLYEGDIMIYHSSHLDKNGLIDEATRWPNGTIPYHIADTFSNKETATILSAMEEYHSRTCIRFRPYTVTDRNWIQIKSDDSGCWSSVGMKEDGQVVNLNSPGCVHHGVVIHELMHAAGFYHQQSASDRDEFVKINWKNIESGREHNFNKYNSSSVTDFGISYDYDSVMHYSGKAFSKNGDKTIEPLKEDVKLGQRQGLSDKDILKLNAMYENICSSGRDEMITQQRPRDHLYIIIKWIEKTFGF